MHPAPELPVCSVGTGRAPPSLGPVGVGAVSSISVEVIKCQYEE